MKKKGVNPELLPDQIKQLTKENAYLKNQYISKKSLEDIMKDNKNMKKEIHNLQVQLQLSDGTQSSLDSGYQVKAKPGAIAPRKSMMNKY